MRYIGIDYGSKRVGIAISNDDGTVGFPHGVLINDQHLLRAVLESARTHGAQTFVIGESKDNKGADNPIMTQARKFAAALKEAGFGVVFEPEQMTSMQVRREMEASGPVDAAAAAVILNSYLERRASASASEA